MLKKLGSLKIKFTTITVLTYMFLVISILTFCWFRFESNIKDMYEVLGKEIVSMASKDIIVDHIPIYMHGDYSIAEYDRTLKKLNMYHDYCNEIYYLYVYHINEETDDATVIFDAITGDEETDKLGDIYELEPSLKALIPKMRRGRDLPTLTDKTQWGYLLTCSRPLIDRDGVCQGYIFVDFNLDDIRKANTQFIFKTFFFVMIITLIILKWGMGKVMRRITVPIEKMYLCLDKFTFKTDKDLLDNIKLFKELNINTNVEITSLYKNFLNVLQQNYDVQHKLNITEIKLEDVKEIAYTDTLTGFGNKRAYEIKIHEYQELIDNGEDINLAVIVADINNLKYVNDTFGHIKGDKYIVGCAKILNECFSKDTMYRIGGDEFVIFVSGDYYKKRFSIMEELHAKFEECLSEEKPYKKYSMSLGIASYNNQESILQVVKSADKEMYNNKLKYKEKYGSYR